MKLVLSEVFHTKNTLLEPSGFFVCLFVVVVGCFFFGGWGVSTSQ